MIKLIDIIVEGRYDALVTQLSRSIVKAIKNKSKKYEEEIISDKMNLEFKILVNIDYSLNDEYAFSVYGTSDDDSIDVDIEINPKLIMKSFNELIYELKGTLRHEVEHISQYGKDVSIEKDASELEGKEYFLASHEVPAFVHDMYKQSKMRKVKWIDVVKYFLNNMKSEHNLSDSDIKEIIKTWSDYARKNLPRAQTV